MLQELSHLNPVSFLDAEVDLNDLELIAMPKLQTWQIDRKCIECVCEDSLESCRKMALLLFMVR